MRAVPADPFSGQTQAIFDATGRFRYWWIRLWDPELPTVNFILLNPSTADEHQIDPTVRRCLTFAARWGFGTVLLTNVFAYRSTDPRALYHVPDPIGPAGDEYLVRAAQEAHVRVAAWGVHGGLRARHDAVLHLLKAHPLTALDATKDHFPKHPLYVRGDARLAPYPYPRVPAAQGCGVLRVDS